jgi:two-component system C4-dicarboxylate transport sensor histidine kinase DctB
LIFSDLQPMRAQAIGHGALAAVATGCVLLLLLVVAQRRRILRQKLEAKALLEQANAQLESKVARRTRALTDTNARLRKEVAERQQAEQTLRAAQDELVQAAKLAVLGQLAAGITHELAQPLGAMRTLSGNAIEFMKRGNLATVEQNLGIIARLADQMGRIITPLKTFARKSPAIPAATDVAHAVGAALFLLDQRLAKAGITVVNHCEPGRAVAWCDQNRLEQVLINLIRNAGDAMADSPTKTLTLAAAPTADGVELSIADTGCGLPEGGALFEPFFTTKPPGEGWASASPSPGHRARVRRRPARRQAPGRRRACPAPARRPQGTAMSQELRVLIIEDDPDVRLGCEQAMMLADLPVEGVGSAEEGLARLKAGFPASSSPTCACPGPTAWRCCAAARRWTPTCR